MQSDEDFRARQQSLTLGTGSVVRGKNSSAEFSRSRGHIARSSSECFYILQILSGEISLEQAGRTNFARSGDVLVFDSGQASCLTQRESSSFAYLNLTVPKYLVNKMSFAHDYLSNIVIPYEDLTSPLLSCLSVLAGNIDSVSDSEMVAVFDASVDLLPLGQEYFQNQLSKPDRRFSRLHREMASYIQKNLDNSLLSARHVAEVFDVSERYVDAVFAHAGFTFSKYVRDRRLIYVLVDLAETKVPIGEIAHRWGFRDLNAFNRAFKERFGCTPRESRLKTNWRELLPYNELQPFKR